MAYTSISLLCRKHKHGEMSYVGEGNYICQTCGFTYHDSDYDDDYSGEALSVYDAALIWASKGKDEDYMFGYSEQQLEKALR